MKGELATSSDNANVSIIYTHFSFKLSYNLAAVRPLFILIVVIISLTIQVYLNIRLFKHVTDMPSISI